jgi:predicted AlkP superfamily pyrophosphatase or phosphodiesterase
MIAASATSQEESALAPDDWAAGLAAAERARVVLLVLDGCGPEFALAGDMPALADLAASGGLAPGGGLADLIASTGPSHATLLTGERPAVHGVLANRLYNQDDTIRHEVRARVPSILDLAREAGRSVTAAVSDPDILVTVNADATPWGWPDRAAIRAHADDASGYIADELTAQRIVEAFERGTDLIFGHLQDIDTAAHAAGLDSERSVAARRLAGRCVGEILAACRQDWRRTVLIVLSDHRMENVTSERPVALAAALGADARVMEDGSAALVEPREPGVAAAVCARALDVPGVAGAARLTKQHFAVWAAPGLVFGRGGPIRTRASHGNVTTRPCLAVVGGGHPSVFPLARRLRRTPPPLHIWAGVLRALLAL